MASKKNWATEPDQEVTLRVSLERGRARERASLIDFLLQVAPSGPGSLPPVTVCDAFQKTVSKNPGHFALKVKRGEAGDCGVWKSWTYREYYDCVTSTAKSMIKLGLEPHHGVGILGFNSPEWYFTYLGAIMVRG